MSKSIYVAEDNSEDFFFLNETFKEVVPHLKLKWAKNGEELISELEQTDDNELPGLIILDYNMPRLNGLQTLKLLNEKERYKEIPKVIYTSGTYKGYITEILQAGALAYFQKGVTLSQIKVNMIKMLSYSNCVVEKDF